MTAKNKNTVTEIEQMTSKEQMRQLNAAIAGKYWNPDKSSIKWFIDKVKESMKKSRSSANTKLTIGHMYTYRYDAKTKEKLPYWDASPLVIPISYYENGFLGINLHYLPPRLRAVLLKEMIKAFATKASNRQYMRISYEKLSKVAKSKMFAPCIKRYLYTHLRSEFLRIPPVEWHRAILIPMANWKKSSAKKVYADSRSMF